MMRKECNEALALLNLMPSYDYLKIPAKEIYALKKNSVEGYEVKIDNLKDAKLSRMAYAIYVRLYKQYVATKEETKKLDEMLEMNEKIKRDKYKIDFNKNKQKVEEMKQKNKNIDLAVIEKKSFFSKIVDKIKRLLKK